MWDRWVVEINFTLRLTQEYELQKSLFAVLQPNMHNLQTAIKRYKFYTSLVKALTSKREFKIQIYVLTILGEFSGDTWQTNYPVINGELTMATSWSYGPIFGEYLYIRFFQGDSELLEGQPFWNEAKLQELLMQIRYSVVPDPDIITEGEQTTSGIICSVHVVVHGDVMLSADLVSFLVLSLVSFLSLYNMFQLYCVEYKEW